MILIKQIDKININLRKIVRENFVNLLKLINKTDLIDNQI